MTRRHVGLRGLLASLLLVQATALWAAPALRAQLDRQRIDIDETVTLTIEQQGTDPAPDFAVLSRDFVIVATSSGSRVRIVDGEVTRSRSWQLQLAPRRAGSLDVPSLRAGRLTTRPLRIDVQRAGASLPAQALAGTTRAVRIETAITPPNRYVQAQLTYTQRLVYAATAQLYGDLPGAPDIPGAIVLPLSAPAPDSRAENGELYGVVEQRFAIFPQRSGTLVVPSARVEASVESPVGRRRAVIVSPPLQIGIAPMPDSYPRDAPWLPAQRITLDERVELPITIAVGTPIVRTVQMRSEGLPVSTLPELPWRDSDALRVYADTPSIAESTDGIYITGTRTERITFVPARAGDVELPGYALTWFDVAARAVRVVRLAPRKLSVQPAADGRGAESDAASAANHRAGGSNPAQPTAVDADSRWIAGGKTALAALIGGLLIAVALLAIRRGLPALQAWRTDPVRLANRQRKTHARRVLEGCAALDARATFRAYAEWRALTPQGKPERPIERGLRAAALRGVAWDSAAFAAWFRAESHAPGDVPTPTATTPSTLPALYPAASDFSTTS